MIMYHKFYLLFYCILQQENQIYVLSSYCNAVMYIRVQWVDYPPPTPLE